ncbi:MAG: phosphoribosyltransferase [Oscillatoriales cyanobacterium C42_A2020_001]|nr:phosphoribosyltransferase [Leptolyngbyaceae cyanobacterium C42_A2020_001]
MAPGSLASDFDSTVCFTNRQEAGERLAEAVLESLLEQPIANSLPLIVYALPRGGLAVAAPVAEKLGCPLDVIVAKKITRPDNRELAIGAVTSDGQTLWLPRPRSPREPAYLYEMALHEAREKAYSQWQQFAPSRPIVEPQGAISLIVDDGVATGMTMAVAVQALRAQQPAQIWICVPVTPPEILPKLCEWADRVIVLATPSPFYSVSRFYRTFDQVETEDAIACLQAANQKQN